MSLLGEELAEFRLLPLCQLLLRLCQLERLELLLRLVLELLRWLVQHLRLVELLQLRLRLLLWELLL